MKKYLVALAAIAVLFASCDKKQSGGEYTSISLKQTEVSLSPGEYTTLNVLWQPTDLEEPAVTWASSNEEVATVANGKVTAVAEGTANITATYGDFKAVCKVTVVAGWADLINWGGFCLMSLDRDQILSPDTFVFHSTSAGRDYHCVMVKAEWRIYDDNIGIDASGHFNGAGYVADMPGTVYLITDSLDTKGPNYYYLGSSYLEIKDFDSFNWNDTANAYCCVTGKLGDAQKHLEWYKDETATLDDVTELQGGIVNAVNFNAQKYLDIFSGLVGEGIVGEDKDDNFLYRVNFSWFLEDDVLYALKGTLEYDEEGTPISWEPKEPGEWGILTPKYYEYLGEDTGNDEVREDFRVKEFVAPKQDVTKFARPKDVLSKK